MFKVYIIIIVAIIILILSRIQMTINAQKTRRVRQLPMVFCAAIAMVIGIYKCLKMANQLIWTCITYLFIHDTNLAILNILLLLGFVVARLILLPIVTKLADKNETQKLFALRFYEYNMDYDEWFLKKEWIDYRIYFFAIAMGMQVATIIFLSATIIMGRGIECWYYVMPCAVVVIVNEMYNYINGQTQEEFEHLVFGDDADSRKISSFYKIREVFEHMLPEPMLSAQTGCEYIKTTSAVDLINQIKDSDDEINHITATYFETNDRFKTADLDCTKATFQLMNRKNVVFYNPFYKDLSMYITLPIATALLSGKKCVVLCSRKTSLTDVKLWLSELLCDYSHMSELWRVEFLSEQEPDCEVGILSFSQIYDKRLINTNKDFLKETDFVLLIEPSFMLNTSQIALSILAEEMKYNEEKPVYCICDRYTDGLVDTLSHLLRDEITNVVAMPIAHCNYTTMTWDADGDFERQRLFDKQTKYLGNGIELAAIAVKNQIPKVAWYSETKVPIKDIKWIAGQYYHTICKYMNQPSQQEKLYDKIDFISNLWSSQVSKEQFLLIEDEFCNMFSTMRAFLSRGKTQIFVNVLSENYLLRDYMRSNRMMFMSNPNAIPSLVPDYAKTERNTILKLILTMALHPVTEEEVLREFHLVGIEGDDTFSILTELLAKYTFVDNSIFTIQTQRVSVDEFTTISSNVYSITNEEFNKHFSDSLKNAYFILEDEESEIGYIDAKLFSHVTQIVLPGQFVTYDGKYYMVKYVAPQSGVVLRRASDLFDGRKYYRQIRKYYIADMNDKDLISMKKVGDIEFAEYRTDFHVDTTGYLEMSHPDDLVTARKIDLSEDPTVGNYSRKYHNKSMLCIKLPECNTTTRFTLCVLLSELFKSVFPSGWQYLAVVSKVPQDMEDKLNHMMYSVEGNILDGNIYIFEDSDLDLGLLNAVEKNFNRFMEILADYLEWHCEKMCEVPTKEQLPPKVSVSVNEKEVRISAIKRIFERMREILASPNKEKPVEETSETPAEASETSEESSETPAEASETSEESSETPAEPGETPEEASETPVDEVPVDEVPVVVEKTDYQQKCFLMYGYEEIQDGLKIEDLKTYLSQQGWANNALTFARTRDIFNKTLIDIEAVNHCDFCGLPLTGASYEKLNDGRTRCNDCSATAIANVEEFRALFYQTLHMVTDIYSIRYNRPITVKMSDARTVAKGVGMVFKPSTQMTGRVLGYAQKKNGHYSLLVENGSPRLAAIDTMVHEMTHIWQYLNWKDNAVWSVYKMNCSGCTKIARDILYEGMAMWSSIQYLYLIGETYYAMQQEAYAEARQDVYGIGFRLYREQYPLLKESALLKYSPFLTFPPLEPADVKEAVKSACKNNPCRC